MILDNTNIIEFRKWILEFPHMKSMSEVEKSLKSAKERFEFYKKEDEKFKTNKGAERLFIAGYNMRTYEMALDKKKALRSEAQKINYKVDNKNGQIGFLL